MLAFVAALAEPLCLAGFASVTPDDFVTMLAWHRAAKAAGGPTRVEKARIALVQFQLSPPKSDLENNVVVSDYAAMDRVYKEERNYILGLVKKVRRV